MREEVQLRRGDSLYGNDLDVSRRRTRKVEEVNPRQSTRARCSQAHGTSPGRRRSARGKTMRDEDAKLEGQGSMRAREPYGSNRSPGETKAPVTMGAVQDQMHTQGRKS